MRIARFMYSALLAGLLSAAVMVPAHAQAPPGLKIQFTTDSLMMCHYYLKTYGLHSVKPAADSPDDFISEAGAYSQAVRLISSRAVWRWFDEVVAGNSDPAGVRKVAASLPASLKTEENRTAVNMLVDGLESAYPKYRRTVYPTELEGLNRVFVGARKRFYSAEARITEALMKQMAFEAVTRPIKVFVVVRTGGASSWGSTSDSYFTVIGTYGQSPMTLLESGIHESTHIVDALQSFTSKSVLSQVRKGVAAADREELEVFLHGLVTFNAGELVKRFLSSGYRHAGIRAQGAARKYQPYLSTYEFIWTDSMDGRMSADEVSKKLVEEFNAVRDRGRKPAGS